jgi:hypothetical protein
MKTFRMPLNSREQLQILARSVQGVLAATGRLDRQTWLGIFAAGVWVTILLGIASQQASPAAKSGPARGGNIVPAPGSVAATKEDAHSRKVRAWGWNAQLVQRADRESEAAIDRELRKLAEFFAECKQGSKPFAEEVLGMGSKLRYAGSSLENGAKAVAELFGAEIDKGPDRFSRYAMDSFERDVLKRADAQRAINAAFTGYAAELERIEAQLLVDLRADLESGDVGAKVSFPPMKSEDMLSASWDRAIGEAVDAVRTDLCVSIANFAGSWVAGDAVADQITGKDGSRLTNLAVNTAASSAFEKVVDAGLARAGYDPAGRIEAMVHAKLDAIAGLVIGGETHIADLVPKKGLTDLATGRSFAQSPDYEMLAPAIDDFAHTLLVAAISHAEGPKEPGLRKRLRELHDKRSRLRLTVLLPLVFDPGASQPKWLEEALGGR